MKKEHSHKKSHENEPQKHDSEVKKSDEDKKHDGENRNYKEDLQRLQAEFENYEKRVQKEKLEFMQYANTSVLKDLLSFLDSFDAAEQNLAKKEFTQEHALQGMESLRKQFIAFLASKGVKEMKTLGEAFNPELHECLLQEHNEKERDNYVLEELQKGYMINDKVLRHAKVKINVIQNNKPNKEKTSYERSDME
jgi:molecular chaperone GrpE